MRGGRFFSGSPMQVFFVGTDVLDAIRCRFLPRALAALL